MVAAAESVKSNILSKGIRFCRGVAIAVNNKIFYSAKRALAHFLTVFCKGIFLYIFATAKGVFAYFIEILRNCKVICLYIVEVIIAYSFHIAVNRNISKVACKNPPRQTVGSIVLCAVNIERTLGDSEGITFAVGVCNIGKARHTPAVVSVPALLAEIRAEIFKNAAQIVNRHCTVNRFEVSAQRSNVR